MCKTVQNRSGKGEGNEGCCLEWKQSKFGCNVFEATWNDNNCCLNIVIGPKVADVALTECKAFLLKVDYDHAKILKMLRANFKI